jgi:integrase
MVKLAIKFFQTKIGEASYRYARHTSTYQGKKLVVTCPAPRGTPKGDLQELLVQKLKAKRQKIDTPAVGADPNMTVNQLGQLFLKDAKDTLKPKTIIERERVLRNWILPEIGGMRVCAVRSRDIHPILDKAYLNSVSTLEHVAKVVKRMFQFAVENEFAISEIPINAGLKKKVRGLIATAKQTVERNDVGLGIEDVKYVLAEVKGKPWEIVYHWMIFCGMRCGEALGVTWQDVDLLQDTVKVNRTVSDANKKQLQGTHWADVTGPIVTTPKTERARRDIPLQPQTKALLEATPVEERNGYIFGTQNGTPMQPKNFRDRVFNPVRKALDMLNLKPHDLRKFFGSFHIGEIRTDIVTVSKWMGHSTPEVTMKVYAKLIPEVESGYKFNMGRAFGA